MLTFKAITSPNSLFENRNIIANKTSMAQTFNNFFVNVGSNLASKRPKARNLFGRNLQKRVLNSFCINRPKHNFRFM